MDRSGAVIMPPTIGAAMRLMTSEPAPVPIRIGKRPARMTATVIALGRTRRSAPSRMASSTSSALGAACDDYQRSLAIADAGFTPARYYAHGSLNKNDGKAAGSTFASAFYQDNSGLGLVSTIVSTNGNRGHLVSTNDNRGHLVSTNDMQAHLKLIQSKRKHEPPVWVMQ